VKKKLEILLEKLKKGEGRAEIEQYQTPATIASDILWYAYSMGDIENKFVVDLGCGNGIFAIGAYLLNAKRVIGIDIDEKMIKIARENARNTGASVEFIKMDIEEFNEKCDTVIMNPPFGSQYANRKADTKFLEKAMNIAHAIYSLHLQKSAEFIRSFISMKKFYPAIIKKYKFPIKASMPFHEKRIAYFDVVAIRAIKI